MVVSRELVDNYDAVDESAVFHARLGVAGLWPLQPETWDEDTFLGLIEVFHDLAVRPRGCEFHSYSGCGWHYQAFTTDTGRALYRWRVNRLLAEASIDLRLADDGEDTGRLVRLVDTSRRPRRPGTADHQPRCARTGRPRDRPVPQPYRHRPRQALGDPRPGRDLEERRELIATRLGSKDEGDLFGAANRFALRHQRRGQQGDYDPAFLDWIFWWYLGTVELTNRLLARDAHAQLPIAPVPVPMCWTQHASSRCRPTRPPTSWGCLHGRCPRPDHPPRLPLRLGRVLDPSFLGAVRAGVGSRASTSWSSRCWTSPPRA